MGENGKQSLEIFSGFWTRIFSDDHRKFEEAVGEYPCSKCVRSVYLEYTSTLRGIVYVHRRIIIIMATSSICCLRARTHQASIRAWIHAVRFVVIAGE